MSHTFVGSGCRIFYNSDGSGDVTVRTPDVELAVPARDLLAFVRRLDAEAAVPRVTVRRDDLEAALVDADSHLAYWGASEDYSDRLRAALTKSAE